MAAALFVIVIVIPVAELWVIVQVAHHIGFLDTLGLLILISIAGAFLLKQQGLATWRRMQDALARGEMPGKEATDAFLVMLGGALLLTPGFLTDVVGIALLLPPTRALFKGATRRMFAGWVNRRTGGAPRRIYEARVIRSGRPEQAEPASGNPRDRHGSAEGRRTELLDDRGVASTTPALGDTPPRRDRPGGDSPDTG